MFEQVLRRLAVRADGRGESDKDLRFVNAKMVRPLSPKPPEGPNLVSRNIGRYPGQEARPVDGDRENIQSFQFLRSQA